MASHTFSIAKGWQWTPQDPFGDLRVRYGIKMGLAGLLALFCTQVLRLPHDNWAILTVLVLMSPQFVGSITVKAIMRVIGTIAGALVGVWLVSDYTSTPAIFLPVLFLVIAYASYKFGQVGARQVPYAYYLLGLTTLTVATDGVTDPAQAWRIGLDRSEEILVGLMSSLLVTSVLWPRYAREEFLEAGRDAAFAECFRHGDCRRQLPTVRGALAGMDDAIQQIRDRKMLAGLPFEAPLRVLDLAECYHATADALDECGRLLCTLQIQRYWGDFGL